MKLRENLAVKGFTVVELVMAMAIAVILFSMMAPVARDFYRHYQLDAESSLMASLLRQSLNDSLINRNAAPHGFYWDANNFVLFQGVSYANRNTSYDRIFPRATSITVNGPVELVFTQLSGRTASSTYSLSNGVTAFNLYINSEGMIND